MRVLMMMCVLWSVHSQGYIDDIPGYDQFQLTALNHQLDPKYVYSMALAESGHWTNNQFIPHPYAISLGVDEPMGVLKHEGYYPETKAQARAILSQLLEAGYRNIGIGLMQVNIKANPDIVDDYLTLLDPLVNLSSASKVLKWCRRYDLPSDVFACYSHGSADSQAGQKYAARVLSYSIDFGNRWESTNTRKNSGIYTFEEFARIAQARYAQVTSPKPLRAPVVISSLTTQ